MKKIILRSITALVIASSVISCTKGFEDLNQDPNKPSAENADPKLFITPVLKDAVFSAHLHQRIHNLYIDNFSQYYNGPLSGVQYGNVNDSWSQDYWKEHYAWLNNLNHVIRNYEKDDSQTNIVAIAKIYRVFITSRATDLFGDIPYSDAADGLGSLPKYDSQEEIYKSMLSDLENAIKLFDDSKLPIGGNDFIYQGDYSKWKKFANSLRLRLAMRISNVEPALAKQHAEAAVAAGVMETSDDSALMVSDAANWGQGYSTKYYFDWGSGNGVGMTNTMYNMLVGYEKDFPTAAELGVPALNDVPTKIDPRALHYFGLTNQNFDCTDVTKYYGNWTGLHHGVSRDDAANPDFFVSNHSRVGIEMHGDITRPFIIMPAHEIWFLRAEGALKGWNMGTTAQAAYEEGITLSMNQWKENAELGTYLGSTNANLNGTTVKWDDNTGTNNSQLDKIITQKYIAGFPDNGWEAWADQRRLKHTLIEPTQNPDDGTGLIKGDHVQRIKYPSNQPSVNAKHYAEAIARQGEDLVSTKIWWAK
jgi:hypothetical protein